MKRAQIFGIAALLLPAPATSQDHSEVRQFVIRSQLAQAGENSIVFAGDSVTEGALLPAEVCGHRVVNAGIGGATASSYLRAMRGIPEFRAAAIIVAIGTNDAAANDNFSRDYLELITALGTYADIVLLAGIPPIERGPVSAAFDLKRAEDIDKKIERIAGDRFIDLRAAMNSGHDTIDGVHLSSKSYSLWMTSILTKLRRSLRC